MPTNTSYDDWTREELVDRVEELEEMRAALLAALDIVTDPDRDTDAVRKQLAEEFDAIGDDDLAEATRGW
jgi:cytochrome oxidase Cu insertion factor (SCO1/SenC/PrrC family)